jgi:hypothetical protein
MLQYPNDFARLLQKDKEMESAQLINRLDVVPRWLHLSSVPTGHHEFSCFVTFPMTPVIPGGTLTEVALTWRLSETAGGGEYVGGLRSVTAVVTWRMVSRVEP